MQKIKFNYGKLKGLIRERNEKQSDLAKILNVSCNTLSCKLNNKTPFTQLEMHILKNYFNLTNEELNKFFFTELTENRWKE